MPAFNAAPFIAEAIWSILDQRNVSLQLLVIDDGSSDDTARIAASTGDSRVRVVRNERNLGLVATPNRAYAMVDTPLVARMDADDVSLPGRLEAQVAFLKEHPEVDVVGCAIERFTDGNRTHSYFRPPATHAVARWFAAFAIPVIQGSILARTQRFRAAGRLDPEFAYAEDYEFFCRNLDTLVLGNLPTALLRVRLHQNQVSQVFLDAQERNSVRVVERLLGAPPDVAAAIHRPELVTDPKLGLRTIDFLVERERQYLRRAKLSLTEADEVRAATSLCIRQLTRAGVSVPTAVSYFFRWSRRDGLGIPGRFFRYAFRRRRGESPGGSDLVCGNKPYPSRSATKLYYVSCRENPPVSSCLPRSP